jgi:hypothetical protein
LRDIEAPALSRQSVHNWPLLPLSYVSLSALLLVIQNKQQSLHRYIMRKGLYLIYILFILIFLIEVSKD